MLSDTAIFTFNTSNQFVSKDSYDKLYKEKQELILKNDEYRNRLTELLQTTEFHIALLKEKDVEIALLKKENEELKKRIEELEVKNKILERKNEILEDRVNKLEYEKMYNKYIVAIQDINSFLFLEKKADSPTSTYLNDLRTNRVDFSHIDKWINIKNDNSNLINYKINILLEKLNSIP